MARFKIRIESEKNKSKVIISVSSDIEEHLIKLLKNHFEVEMMSATITNENNQLLITFFTENKEKVDLLRLGIHTTFMEMNGMQKPSLN